MKKAHISMTVRYGIPLRRISTELYSRYYYIEIFEGRGY